MLSTLQSKRVRLAAVAGTALITAGTGYAQGSPDGAETFQLEEIIITAQKRTEDLQKASVAVTAITGDTLNQLGVTSASDLTQVVPNLTVNNQGPGAAAAMRGVVSSNNTEVGNPAVAFNLDGVYLARQRSITMSMYDIERVEVLRGPQGTLYGRNATGGSINLITAKPELNGFSAKGSVGFGNYNAINVNGAMNMPLSDSLALRTAFLIDRHDGYVETWPNSRDFDDLDVKSARVHLLWKPSENFSALLTHELTHSGGAGHGGFGNGAPLGEYARASGSTPYRWYVTPKVQLFLDQTVKSTTATLNWYTPYVDMTYVGNYRSDDWRTMNAQSANGPGAGATNCPTPFDASCTANPNSSDDSHYSHELRFSKDTDSLRWVLGLYYFKEENVIFNGVDPLAGETRAFVMPSVNEESKAAFGQVTWSITDRLRLIGGLRHTKDNKGRNGVNLRNPLVGQIFDFQCVACVPFGTPNYADLDWSKTTWRTGIDFDLSQNSLLFASVTTGYKAGGYGDGEQPRNDPYGPETLINYELGWKNQLFDRRLQLNIDAFFTKYNDYQATAGAIDPFTQQPRAFTVNAGNAEIKGVELETVFLLTPNDRVDFNATVLDAKFSQFDLPFGDAYSPVAGCPSATIAGCAYSLTGMDMPYAADTTARLAYEHTFELASGANVIARVDSNYSSSYNVEFHGFDVLEQDAYTRTGAALTYQHNDQFSVQLWAKNLEDDAILAAGGAHNGAPGRRFDEYARQGFYMTPRTFGVRFSASFD